MNMSPYILISFDLLARAVLTPRNPLRVKVKIVERMLKKTSIAQHFI